jgi:hypothetical protein
VFRENDLDRESIAVAYRYATCPIASKRVTRAEFIASWTPSLQEIAGEVWDASQAAKAKQNAHILTRQHLVKIGGRSLNIAIPGPNNSSLHWYAMRGHIVIFQAFNDDERWEIFTSLSSGNKVLLADAYSALSSLAGEKNDEESCFPGLQEAAYEQRGVTSK